MTAPETELRAERDRIERNMTSEHYRLIEIRTQLADLQEEPRDG